MIQARGGFMQAQGEPGGEPVYLQLPTCDYGTALSAAYGVILALIARERTGLGDRVETSLADSAFTMQAGEFLFVDGKIVESPPGGRDLGGLHALHRVYATADGYVMVACRTEEQATVFVKSLGLGAEGEERPPENSADATQRQDNEDLLGQPLHSAVAESIDEKMRTRSAAEWMDFLAPLGVPIAPCVTVAELFDDPHAAANDLWWEAEHPRWGRVQQTGRVIHWDALSMHLARRAPLIGEHSVDCLRELGVDEERIAALIRDGAVVQGEL
jgi:formyl-CoA transferase